MNKKHLFGFVLCTVVAIVFLVIAYAPEQAHAPITQGPSWGWSAGDYENQVVNKRTTPYGTVQMKTGETAVFEGLELTVLELIEDSRCPVDVQCIQAGTVRVQVETVSGVGTSTSILALEDAVVTKTAEVVFTTVEPLATTRAKIEENQYVFTFTVSEKASVETPPQSQVGEQTDILQKKCYVGGCSSQICSSEQGIVSTCEYRESYACYASAVCEVQPSGECGWTQTTALTACLQGS